MKGTIAILEALYNGAKLSNKNFFDDFGYTNIAREIARKIEQPFNIKLIRDKKIHKSRYGEPVYFFEYSLNKEDKTKVKEILKKLKNEKTEKTKTTPTPTPKPTPKPTQKPTPKPKPKNEKPTKAKTKAKAKTQKEKNKTSKK